MGYITNWLKTCVYQGSFDPNAKTLDGAIVTPKGYKWGFSMEKTPTPKSGSVNVVSDYNLTSLELDFPHPMFFGLLRKIKFV